MKSQNHSFPVDFFALGIMGYEFMLGRRPYTGRSRREIKEQMMSKNIQISFGDIPNGWSEDAADFFNRLLQRKPEMRLGFKGIWELKQHRWMKFFPWEKLYNKELESPFLPEKKDNFDKRYCEANDTINIDTKIRYEKYKSDIEYDNYFLNFTYYGIISENEEEKKEEDLLTSSLNFLNNKTQTENKENDNTNLNNLKKEETTDIEFKPKEEYEIKKQINNSINKKYIPEKLINSTIRKSVKNISFTMKLSESQNNIKKDSFKITKDKSKNSINLKKERTPKQSILLMHNNSLENYSESFTNRYNSKLNKNSRSRTPIYNSKKSLLLEGNNKYIDRCRSQNKINIIKNESIINKKLMMNKNHYNNYQENIRNMFSKKARQNMNIYSPGYYSKQILNINCSTNKINELLSKKSNQLDYSKSPTRTTNSINMTKNTKSPKITSTSSTYQGYKNRSKSISPLRNSQYISLNSSVKNIHKKYINERSIKSRINLSDLYNQNFSYAKRIKELNSYNYKNNNIKNINTTKDKTSKNNEIISSYSISSSNILKQIRNANYSKNKINKENPSLGFNNVKRGNKRMSQNNKISLELELNADSQTFNKCNNRTNRISNKSQKRKNIQGKNNIINKSNSTINISAMKMGMNGNININVVIKGNNNTTNLINKIELKKKNGENENKGSKKLQRSHSIGFFNLNL